MPISLNAIDLTGKGVGFTDKITFQQIGGVDQYPGRLVNPPHVRIYNESSDGISLSSDNATWSEYLPAGAWSIFPLLPGMNSIIYTIIYTIINPPVSKLLVTYYFPNETVPAIPQLGNSAIAGGVNTTSIQTLSNENNASPVLVIDIGLSGHQQLWTINSDGTALLQVYNSTLNQVHQVLKINAAANYLQLGQAGDIAEALGQLKIDQLLTAALGLTVSASGATITGGTTTDTLSVTSTSTFTGTATFNGEIAPSLGGTVINGTSGSITFFTPYWGTDDKVVWAYLNGYINNVIVSFNFPTVMNVGKIITGNWGSNVVTCTLFKSGSSISVRCLTALGASGGGTITSETNIFQNSIAFLPSGGADQIQMGSTASAITSFIEIKGV